MLAGPKEVFERLVRSDDCLQWPLIAFSRKPNLLGTLPRPLTTCLVQHPTCHSRLLPTNHMEILAIGNPCFLLCLWTLSHAAPCLECPSSLPSPGGTHRSLQGAFLTWQASATVPEFTPSMVLTRQKIVLMCTSTSRNPSLVPSWSHLPAQACPTASAPFISPRLNVPQTHP